MKINKGRRDMLKATGVLFAAALGSRVAKAMNVSDAIVSDTETYEPQQQQRVIRKVKFLPEHCNLVRQAGLVKSKKLKVTDIEPCDKCVAACPRKAITTKNLVPDTQLNEPVLNEKLCINCGRCVRTCPSQPKAWELWDMTNNKKLF